MRFLVPLAALAAAANAYFLIGLGTCPILSSTLKSQQARQVPLPLRGLTR
jgi:hypothetical protein